MSEKFELAFGKKIFGTKKQGAKEKWEISDAKRILKELFLEGDKEFSPYEKSKTETDKKSIEQIGWAVDFFIKFLGGKPEPLEINRIHFLEPGGVESLFKVKEGWHDILRHFVAIDSISDVQKAVKLAHELFHIKSHQRTQLTKKGEVRADSSGLKIFSKEDKNPLLSYLGELDEAINAELTHQLFKKYIEKNPLYAGEINKVEEIKPWISRALEKKGFDKESRANYLENVYTVIGADKLLEILESKESSDQDKIDEMWRIMKNLKKDCGLVTFERPKEWSKFNELVVEILNKSEGEFKSRWAVIFEFAKAKFTGNLSPLRKTVERILGTASFERIMKKFSIKE